MEPILTIDNLNSFGGNMLRQGDKSQLKYRLRDVGNKNLGISSKSCQVKMYGRNYTTVVYETTTTVSSDNTVTFTIDKVLPKGTFYLEFTVGDYIFPTDHREFFEITPSGKGMESNIIEIVGKDVLIQEVKSQVDAELQPLVTSLESAQQAEAQRVTAESTRVSAEEQRKTDHANRSAELARKADKVVIRNMVLNSDFDDGLWQWHLPAQLINTTKVVDGKLHVYWQNSGNLAWPAIQQPSKSIVGHTNYFRVEISEMASNSIGPSLQDKNRTIITNMSDGIHSTVRTIDSGQTLPNLYINHAIPTGAVIDYKIDNIMSIDLTETFGAGNEPTKEEMDELIDIIGHVDGTYLLNNKEMLGYLMKGIHEKANKKQEDWIAPTLLNGTTEKPPSGATENRVGYRLYDDGVVRLRGTVDATGLFLSLFTLPPGYRPTQEIKKVVSAENKFGIVRIFTSGNVTLAIGSLNEVVLDDIEFDVR